VLVELDLVEQRYKAVLNDGASATDVARRYGVGRQAVHTWLRRYAASGLARTGPVTITNSCECTDVRSLSTAGRAERPDSVA
jgi:transposase-like protein